MGKRLIEYARRLRGNMREAEKLLWARLRRKTLEVQFRKQAPIGSYIVDFVCFERRLIIELDGGQHSERSENMERDTWLRKQGFKVLRFWNNGVLRNITPSSILPHRE